LDQALVSLQWDPRTIVIVTDIGCVGLSDQIFQTNAFHGLHGRSITYATGIKLANPDLHVIVLIGDGGCGIGGNHLINAARRNMGITVLVANNFNFGMTGGQHSVLTPQGAITTTTRAGNLERPLDLCATVSVCGAGFVARSTVFDKNLSDLIRQALQHDGFALVDVWELCTAYFAPSNRFSKKDLFELLEYGGWATGILAQNDRPEYAAAYRRQVTAHSETGKPAPETGTPAERGHALQPCFTANLQGRLKVIIAGAAGGKVRSTGHLLGRGGGMSGLYATQRDDYPVTVMTGHSLCEVILDTMPIGYTGITRPDVLILVAEEGRSKAMPRLAAMTSLDRAYIAQDLLEMQRAPSNQRACPACPERERRKRGRISVVEGACRRNAFRKRSEGSPIAPQTLGHSLQTQAQVIPLDFDSLDFRVTRQNRAIVAMAAVLRREKWYPFEALEAVVRDPTQRAEIIDQNLAALKASEGLVRIET
jgi:Pyruvate/2-oxoacid:ferredoxin oxidoreductase gamma subunit